MYENAKLIIESFTATKSSRQSVACPLSRSDNRSDRDSGPRKAQRKRRAQFSRGSPVFPIGSYLVIFIRGRCMQASTWLRQLYKVYTYTYIEHL